MPAPKLPRATAIRFARLHMDGAADPDFAVQVGASQLASMYNAIPGSLNLTALRTSRPVLNNLYALVGTEPWPPWARPLPPAWLPSQVGPPSPLTRGRTFGPPPRPPWSSCPARAH